jgi:hypothetical protein
MSSMPKTVRTTRSPFLRGFFAIITLAAIGVLIVGAYSFAQISSSPQHSHIHNMADDPTPTPTPRPPCVGGAGTPCGG